MNIKISSKLIKTIISIVISLVLAGVLIIFASCRSDYGEAIDGEIGKTAPPITSVQPADSETQQVIEVTASGGYSPRKIDAKAGIPTILTMKSEGAYGCERAFNIPALKISEILPENGQKQFDLGIQAKGTKLLGVCSMGMYSFQIFFN